MPSLADRSKRAAREITDAASRRLGFEVVRRSFYSPLPDRRQLPDSLWSGPAELPGVELNVDGGLALLREMAPYLAEFTTAVQQASGFRLDNGTYETGDAETLFAMLRQFKPARVLELGSGTSSHIISAALRTNQADGNRSTYRVFDPYPWQATELGPASGVEVVALGATEVPPSEYAALEPGDVLFVDTTHTVKTGGDVNHLLLEVVPRLPAGVIVHFHDIFLPYEYPREWVVEMRLAWAEQYLLQAFLAFNRQFEVLLPVHALARTARDELDRLIPGFHRGAAPGAFWIRRAA
jgi:hypothetical protein